MSSRTSRQLRRKRRDTIIGVIAVMALVAFVLGPSLIHALIVPDMPGYLKHQPAGNYTPLDWEVLLKGDWPADGSPKVPPAVQAMDGKQVALHGFMAPPHQPGAASVFYVSAKPRGCYFCYPPGIMEVARIKIAGAQEIQYTDWPVMVYGKFRVATGNSQDETLYMIDDAQLKPERM